MRPIHSGEVRPISGEISLPSGAVGDPDTAAERAFDLDLETYSKSLLAPDGTQWLKLKLGKVFCVQRVLRISKSGETKLDWTCSRVDCSDCVGQNCEIYSLTIYTEVGEDGDGSEDCKLGDTLKLERSQVNIGGFVVNEVAVIAKSQGKAT